MLVAQVSVAQPAPEPPATPSPPPDLPPPGLANEPDAIAGYDHGLYIATRDDAFHLGISGWLQARWELDRAGDAFQDRFSLPVGRLLLAGHAFGTTDFLLAADGGAGTAQILDAYIDQPVPFAKLRVGAFKPFFSQQQLTHRVDLELTDRPITFAFAGIDRDLGASLHHEPAFATGGLEWSVGVFDGTGIAATSLCQVMGPVAACGAPSNVPADARPLVAARFGWRTARADPLHEADLDDDAPRLAIGVGYAGDLAQLETRAMKHDITLDVVFKANGWSLTAAGFIDSVRSPTARTTDFAWHAQAGYMIVPRLLELAARFAQLSLPAGDVYEGAAALDIYRRGHALKWQLEGARLEDTSLPRVTWLWQIQTQLLF